MREVSFICAIRHSLAVGPAGPAGRLFRKLADGSGRPSLPNGDEKGEIPSCPK
jgi:hypothetical protein